MSKDFEFDLEKGKVEREEDYRNSPQKQGIPVQGRFGDDKPVKTGEETVSTPVKTEKPSCGRSGRKEKRKKSASKPPRPPRGPSLDAADQKLIKEITELAMLKRTRIERMRALKKMKDVKAASTASSLSNVFATVFTIIFCFVIIFQGMWSTTASKSFGKSVRVKGGLVPVQHVGNPSASEPNVAYTGPVIAHSGLPEDGISLFRSNRKMSLRFTPK